MIAIDGPAGAGKSTVARQVAERLGYMYVDTGAMYRAMALAMLRARVPLEDPAAVERCAAEVPFEVDVSSGITRVFLQGEDVTGQIRTPEVSRIVSAVAAVPGVRRRLVKLQRRLAERGGIVMDGRDIGTVVLPGADVKIFLTASLEERARRRWREWWQAGRTDDMEDVRRSLEERDRLDSARDESPLRVAPDAVVIDTTGESIERVVARILRICRGRLDRCSTE